jgi:hypothetical protein
MSGLEFLETKIRKVQELLEELEREIEILEKEYVELDNTYGEWLRTFIKKVRKLEAKAVEYDIID